MSRDIVEFTGYNRWLSNFWPCEITFEGLEFRSVEAAYVAAKTKDLDVRKKVQSFVASGDCKRFGRSIKLRDDWEEIKLGVMRDLLVQKFAPGSPLAVRLLETGNCTIVEGNTWGDTFWGVFHGVGENNLGKLLMEIREGLK